jgi:hypothetical protein
LTIDAVMHPPSLVPCGARVLTPRVKPAYRAQPIPGGIVFIGGGLIVLIIVIILVVLLLRR